MSQRMMPANAASRSSDVPASETTSVADSKHLVGVHRSTQPMLPGMEEYVRDSVAQPATPNSRPQGREHDVELAFQHLKSRMKPLLTKREAADFYTVSERTIDRWVLDATLPNRAKIIIGGSVRFRTDVLLECIAASGTTAS